MLWGPAPDGDENMQGPMVYLVYSADCTPDFHGRREEVRLGIVFAQAAVVPVNWAGNTLLVNVNLFSPSHPTLK